MKKVKKMLKNVCHILAIFHQDFFLQPHGPYTATQESGAGDLDFVLWQDRLGISLSHSSGIIIALSRLTGMLAIHRVVPASLRTIDKLYSQMGKVFRLP